MIDEMIDEELLNRLTILRYSALTTFEQYSSTKQSLEVVKNFLRNGLEAVERKLGQLYLYDQDGMIKGYLLHWYQTESWYGPAIQNCVLDYDWKDQSALLWMSHQLLEAQAHLGDRCEFMIGARYAPILGVLLSLGFGIDSVVLLGHPKEALQQLNLTYAPTHHLGYLNLGIQPLQFRHEIEQIIQLKQNYFSRHPEFCWFGAHERHLSRHKEELIQALRVIKQGGVPKTHIWVLVREGQLMGAFSYSEEERHPLWGHSAGLDIIFDPRIQHKGVVKTAYKIMLESMVHRKIEVFKGGTSQIAVMTLGKAMKRPLFAWVVRRKTYFPYYHFQPYLPNSLGLQGAES
jgi:hypothetical protein